jgi:hypothetical protein
MRSGTLSGVAATRTIFMIEPPRPALCCRGRLSDIDE